MIEHLRKYTGLIIFVMALLFVGLTFLDRSSSRGAGSHDPVRLTVSGTSYTYSEYQKIGPSSARLAMMMQMYNFLANLDGLTGDEKGMDKFVANRLIVRQAAKDFGIHPSDTEVAEAVKGQMAFHGQDGSFDQVKYNQIVTSPMLGSLGLTEKDLLDLVRDDLALTRLTSIIGGGLATSQKMAAEMVESTDQKLTLQVARLPLSKYQESLKPTDEELKADWETSKDKYVTDKQMKVTYLLATPKYPEPAKPEEAPPATATEEEKKAFELKKATTATTEAEEKRRINKELGGRVNLILDGINKSKGADFEKLAADNGFELKSTDFFALTALPPELDGLKPRFGDSQAAPLSSVLASLSTAGDDATYRFTTAIPIVDGQSLIVRADEIKDSRTKDFEEAKEQVRVDYVAKHASENLKKDADEKVAKLREALAAGKSFADAAKELELEVKNHGPFGMNDRDAADPDAGILFQPASTADVGSIVDAVIRPDAALLIFVEKREIVKDPQRSSRIDQALERQVETQKRSAFSSWLEEKLVAAKVDDHSNQ